MTGEYRVQHVRQEDCYWLWQQVRDLLAPAIEESNGRWKPEYVFAALVAGRQTLWVVLQDEKIVAAYTTEISNYPERRLINVHYLGGHGFDDWYRLMLEAVTEAGRALGCDGIEMNARFGFWKWLKNDGFDKKSCFYEKKI